jgi:hypothetical protein
MKFKLVLKRMGKKRRGVIESPNNFVNFENPSTKKGFERYKV